VRVFVTGATGFVGSALVARLIQAGHAVVASSRNPVQARATLGPAATVVATTDDVQALAHALEGCGAVVNLAGEPVAGRRWTPAVAAAIHDSRAGATRRIVQAMACLAAPPSVLVSASAVGIYGDRGDERLDSSSRAGSSPLARFVLCIESECLDPTVPLGLAHLWWAIGGYIDHCITERPHQGLGGALIEPGERSSGGDGEVRCRERVGGLPRFYYREAA
jgi:nucleoside-diphosphate-sugar epimerase